MVVRNAEDVSFGTRFLMGHAKSNGSAFYTPSESGRSCHSDFTAADHLGAGASSLNIGVRSRVFNERHRRNQTQVFTLDKIEEGTVRWRAAKVLYSPHFELLMSAVLVSNCAVIMIDADMRARGADPAWFMGFFADFCFVVYLIEFLFRLIVERRWVLQNSWNRLDLFIIVVGVLELVLTSLTFGLGSSITMIRILRVVRVLRVIRAVKLMASLHELRKLIHMMLTCIKTLAWSFVMCFIVMTIWAIALVEIVHPIILEMANEDATIFDGDDTWISAYSSVMRANLTLFQTVVAGDSWGKVAVPVMARAPATVFVFVPALITLVYGVLNLIIAVVVDTFAEQRSQDLEFLLMERHREEQQEKLVLKRVFDDIDTNKNGTVDIDELTKAADEIQLFQQRLKLLDIGRGDLTELFAILDEDGSGEIDADEFIDVLYRMRCADHKSTSVIMKSYIQDMKKQLNKLCSNMEYLTEVCTDVDPNQKSGLRDKGTSSTAVSKKSEASNRSSRSRSMSRHVDRIAKEQDSEELLEPPKKKFSERSLTPALLLYHGALSPKSAVSPDRGPRKANSTPVKERAVLPDEAIAVTERCQVLEHGSPVAAQSKRDGHKCLPGGISL